MNEIALAARIDRLLALALALQAEADEAVGEADDDLAHVFQSVAWDAEDVLRKLDGETPGASHGRYGRPVATLAAIARERVADVQRAAYRPQG
jgi:hypothetical protein